MAPVWRSAFFLLAAVVVAVKEGGSGQSPLTVRTQGFNAEGCGWVLDDEKFKNFYSMTVHHRVTLDLMETPAVSALGAFVDDQLRGLSEVASRPPFGPFKDKKVYVMDIYGVPGEKIEYMLCAGLFFPRVFNDVKNITMNSAKVFATNATIGSLASPNELTFSSVPVPPPGSPPPPPNPPPNPPPPLPSPPPPPSPHPPPHRRCRGLLAAPGAAAGRGRGADRSGRAAPPAPRGRQRSRRVRRVRLGLPDERRALVWRGSRN